MTKNEQELFNTIEGEGMEIIEVSDLGLTLENTPVTHAIAMENWKTRELTNGHPADHNALYWDNTCEGFDEVCEQIVKHF